MIFEHEFDQYTLLPRHSSLSSRSDIDLEVKYREDLVFDNPLVSAPMASVTDYEMAKEIAARGGIGILHRYMPDRAQISAINRVKSDDLSVFQAISTKPSLQIDVLCKSQVSGLCIDVAHGDTDASINIIRYIRERAPNMFIISGNIVTKSAALRLKEAGVSAFRVGIGAGHACVTRKVSGIGRNQLKAISEIHKEFPDTPIFSCGGIRHSGDVVKCLAAGASGVIIGKLFSTTTESAAKRIGPGKVVYAGMASYFAEEERIHNTNESRQGISQHGTYEGEYQILQETGSLRDTVHNLCGGIRAGLAYLGCRSIRELHLAVSQGGIEWEDIHGRPVIF